jgi:3-isopropylmalate dehydrogenase
MFEPVHGSAPKYAGKNVANPVGAVLSAALMLETLGLESEARAIEAAVEDAVRSGNVTADVGGGLGTKETGDYIVGRVTANA